MPCNPPPGWDQFFDSDAGSALGHWLLWLGLLLLAAAAVRGAMLAGMGALVYDSSDIDKETGKRLQADSARKGLQPVGLIRFTMLKEHPFQQQVKCLAPRSQLLLTRWLSFDYGFMMFAYPALALLGLWLVLRPDVYGLCQWREWWLWVVVLLPLLAWIADALENRTSREAIRQTSAGLAATDPPVKAAALESGARWVRRMRACSIAKWTLVSAAILVVVLLGIAALIW